MIKEKTESPNKADTQEKEFSTTALIILYFYAMICIIVSPIIAKKIAPSFDYISYGAMRAYITEIITCIIWSVEIVAVTIFCKKKWNKTILANPKTKGKELSGKQMILLSAISIFCIYIISAQIGFEVKPFYDLGVKFTGYELMADIGVNIRNAIKCVWMILMIRCSQNTVERILKSGKSKMIWGGIVLMFTQGIYDLLMGLTTLPITYLLLNLVFGLIYILTDRSISKTYLFILLIYFF